MESLEASPPVFASFVTQTEVGIAIDPVFSREALSRLDVSELPDRFNKGRNANKPRTYGDRSPARQAMFLVT